MNKIFARIGAAALAAAMTLSAAACSSALPQIPGLPGDSPSSPSTPFPSGTENGGFVPVSISSAVKEDTYSTPNGLVLMESTIETPTVSGGGNGAAEKIEKYLNGEIAAAEAELSEELDWYLDDPESIPEGPAGFSSIGFDTARSDEQMFTLLCGINRYHMGAIHPSYNLIVYNFDPQTGERLKLSSLGINGRDPSEDIAYRLAKKYVESDYSSDYSTGMSDALDQIYSMLDDEEYSVYDSWYISGDTFVFISNEYALASYAAGMFVITLDAEELNGIVDESYFADDKTVLPANLSDYAIVNGSQPHLPGYDDYDDSEDYGEDYDEDYGEDYDSENGSYPCTTLTNDDDLSRFDFVHLIEIPSEYMEDCLIWWDCDVYDIAVYELEWDENFDTVVGGNIVCSLSEYQKGDVLRYCASIPEIIPSHGLTATIDGVKYDWALCYNGRDGGLSFMEIDPQAAG